MVLISYYYIYVRHYYHIFVKYGVNKLFTCKSILTSIIWSCALDLFFTWLSIIFPKKCPSLINSKTHENLSCKIPQKLFDTKINMYVIYGDRYLKVNEVLHKVTPTKYERALWWPIENQFKITLTLISIK